MNVTDRATSSADAKTTRITFSIDAKTKREFQKTAIDAGDDMSGVLRKSVDDYINHHKLTRVYS